MPAPSLLGMFFGFVLAVGALTGGYALYLFLPIRAGRRKSFRESVAPEAVLILFVVLILLVQFVLSLDTQFLFAILSAVISGVAFCGLARVLWSRYMGEAC